MCDIGNNKSKSFRSGMRTTVLCRDYQVSLHVQTICQVYLSTKICPHHRKIRLIPFEQKRQYRFII